MAVVYDFEATTIDGALQSLAAYRGKVLVIVNVASKCGFTPQYAGLEALHRKLEPRGVQVLGFPCDQFGHQEPGDEHEIKRFCALTYDVTFPLYAKVLVNGESAHPLYRWLKHERPGVLGIEAIKWNFTKFLIDRGGRAVARYAPTVGPAAIEKNVEALAAAPVPGPDRGAPGSPLDRREG